LLHIRAIALLPPDRRALAARIERRFDAMVEAGFVAEVARLRARGDLAPELPSMRAVGYRQIWAYLSGECTWEEARRRALAATRQLAKRQLTWLRGDDKIERWPAYSADLTERFAKTVVADFTARA